jgi:hypothetical protein
MCNVAHVRQTLNLIIKHIPVGGRVEKKMWYFWIEDHDNISKIKKQNKVYIINNILWWVLTK